MKQFDYYTYRVFFSEPDGEFVGLCAEFPSLSWLADTPERALSGIRQLLKDVLEDMQQNGETPPQPLAQKKYSGKFMVRIPADSHRRLAVQAAEQGVSLNRLISSKLG